jgi:hypothetical protein
MNETLPTLVRFEEFSCVLQPEPGVDIYDAILAAQFRGFRSITVNAETNTATVVVYKRVET